MRGTERQLGQKQLNVVHTDASRVVIDKPQGLLSVPGRGPDKADCAYARVLNHWPEALVVHRLDMDTSGLLLFARGKAAQRELSMAFAARTVRKRYVALVDANALAVYQASPKDAQGWALIDWPMRVDWPQRPKSVIDKFAGKPSVTHWRPDPHDATRLWLEPMTGRSHQLRVHLSALGMPIVGDRLYGGASASRMMLHACDLWLPATAGQASAHISCESPF